MLNITAIHGGGPRLAAYLCQSLIGDGARAHLPDDLKELLGITREMAGLKRAHLGHLFDGRTISGEAVPGRRYAVERTITRRSPHAPDGQPLLLRPVTAIDFCWSPDKSVSITALLSTDAAERAAALWAHRTAVEQSMHQVANVIGLARQRGQGRDGWEKGQIGWLTFDHETSRPVREGARADPQLHSHCLTLNHVLTESGRVTALASGQAYRQSKELRLGYHQELGQQLRARGLDAVTENGITRIRGIGRGLVKEFSKRLNHIRDKADEFAKDRGWQVQPWLLRSAAGAWKVGRVPKDAGERGTGDREAWQEQRVAYQHKALRQELHRIEVLSRVHERLERRQSHEHRWQR